MSLLKIYQVSASSASSTGSILLFATNTTGVIYKRTGYPTTYNNVTTTIPNSSTTGVTLNTTRVDLSISNCVATSVATKSGIVVTVAFTLPVV